MKVATEEGSRSLERTTYLHILAAFVGESRDLDPFAGLAELLTSYRYLC